MELNSFYPVIGTDKIAAARDFYTKWLGFELTFEAEWYVSLRRQQGGKSYELALLDYTHPTVPAAYRKPVQGLLLNFEVDDVDSAYQRLVTEADLPEVLPLRTEEFGQRHYPSQHGASGRGQYEPRDGDGREPRAGDGQRFRDGEGDEWPSSHCRHGPFLAGSLPKSGKPRSPGCASGERRWPQWQ